MSRMRDLKKNLVTCEATTSGELVIEEEKLGDYLVYTCRLRNGYRLGHFYHHDDAVFFQQAREGWPEAIRRATEAEARVKELEDELMELASDVWLQWGVILSNGKRDSGGLSTLEWVEDMLREAGKIDERGRFVWEYELEGGES